MKILSDRTDMYGYFYNLGIDRQLFISQVLIPHHWVSCGPRVLIPNLL